jgi:hypothetical protein
VEKKSRARDSDADEKFVTWNRSSIAFRAIVESCAAHKIDVEGNEGMENCF